MGTVSIHIVTFNSVEHIDDCLEGVFGQTYPIQSVVIIDNASKDGTQEQLAKWQSRCSIVFNKENNGFAGGHNQAIRMTDSDFCLILNPDVILDCDYVAQTIRCLIENERGGSATGKLLFKADPTHIDSTGLVINKARRAFDRGAHQSSDLFKQAEEVFGVSGAAAMYARKMIEDICLDGEFFDEDFFAYKEDVDVAWRAQLFGWKALYEPTAVAYHERGWKEGGRGSRPLFVRRLSYINRYKMIMKNDRSSMVIKHMVPLLVYECLSFGYAMIREPNLLGAWSDFWGKYGELKRKRSIIQGRRRATDRDVYRWFS
nr:glycosyltransferase family 2 protein [Paenibacillus sp. HWE-109]